MSREVEIPIAKRDGAAFDGLGLVAVVFEVARRAVNLDFCLPKGFALFQGQALVFKLNIRIGTPFLPVFLKRSIS